MEAADENTQLKRDFDTNGHDLASQNDESDPELEINEAIETAGFGCGTILHSLGPFLMFCLEGGEIIVLSIVGIMLRCEWNLTTFWVTFLQVTRKTNVYGSYIQKYNYTIHTSIMYHNSAVTISSIP